MHEIITNLGIPYMGSKRRIAHEIIGFITRRHPEANEFYDIFGGGGAMSFVAIQMPQFKKVVYNELNTQVVELIRYCQNLPKDKELYKLGQIYPDKFYEWVSREDFKKNMDRQDYYGGLISTIWSFGNSGDSYLFGKDVEETKRLAHMVCVYKDQASLKILNKRIKVTIPQKILTLNTIYGRRMFLKKCVARHTKVSELQRLQQLELFNVDYLNFDFSKISDNAIVYLDPPYINTADYKNNTINYDELYNWIKAINAHVYLSSYESPMQVVRIMKHNSNLAAGGNKPVFEKLYYKPPIN